MVELGFMIQEYYDNACAEITVEMNGCFNADILWFVNFCEYSVSPKVQV